jgi:cytochrome c oxidase accessory protein FixG
MVPTQKRPNLDSVTTINDDGSRFFLHPADVRGRFTLARRLTGILLIAIYILLPLIPINGHPAVFLDVENRRFHLLGLTFLVQDVWLLFFVISGLGFSLFFVTSLLGRIWCGWACPYTVFLDHVFRRIERFIDGDAAARRKLDAAPWGITKTARRLFKHALYLLCAAAIAHIFLSYFVSLEKLYGWMRQSPSQHFTVFAGVMALTAILYFCFSWFREQFCVIMCPYGRLQSALTDDDTLNIGYDRSRGEPRGKASDPTAGSCIDCRRCVQVCPAGIDIRNGLQMECIGCAACVDACDEVMTRLQRPRGLVRYDSLNGLASRTRRIFRPRIALYSLLLLAGAGVSLWATTRIHSFEMSVVRMRGMPYMTDNGTVRNQFILRLMSKATETTSYQLATSGGPAGLTVSGMDSDVTLEPEKEIQKTVMFTIPMTAYTRPFPFTIEARPTKGGDIIRKSVEFLGPDPTTTLGTSNR